MSEQMSLWTKLQALPEEALRQVHQAYGEHFPIEVRCALADWIEEKPWIQLDPDNPQHEHYAASLVTSLIQEIEQKANTEEHLVMRLKLSQAAQHFRNAFASNPFTLVRIVKQCLHMEYRVIQQAENYLNLANQETKPFICDPHQEIHMMIEKLRRQTSETEVDLKRMQEEQEQFALQIGESQKRQAYMSQLSNQPSVSQNIEIINKLQREKEMLDNALRMRAASLVELRKTLIDKYQQTFVGLSQLQQRVLDVELIHWKRNQQFAGNGQPFENNIDQIQEWCESLAEMIWFNRQQMKQVENLFMSYPLNNPAGLTEALHSLAKQITSLLSSLVTSTFIIEKQPPQVMKTNTRFQSTVRLLVGGKLNVHMTPPQVKVTIISEHQAQSLLKIASDKISMSEASGEILNNNGTMEYHQATRQLTINFRNMQLKKIKRAEKKGTESVMDEKFSLLFQSQFKVGGELVFQVWTLSLPVVVIVHGNQEPHAWATITWDNAFAETGRVPFAVPDKVVWTKVGEVLSQKFKTAVGRGLSEDNLRFLAGKAFRNTQLPDFNNGLLTWSQFSKEQLPERNFTFWEWFYAILKVTREHLRGLWSDGNIMGFVGRKQAEEMLLKKSTGTFLLRFSDSELGGVTIAWVAEGQEGPQQECYMIQPFTSRDFGIRGLADRINDLKHLTYLYPDIPKDQAFGKYYTPVNETHPPASNGYVKPVLVTHIPGWNTNMPFGSLDSFPNTPQSVHHNPQSPSDASLTYHDNPASVQSSGTDHVMNAAGGTVSDMDYADFLNMDLVAGDMDDPVDFSNINVNELMAYSKSD